jgi:hypothetical protein
MLKHFGDLDPLSGLYPFKDKPQAISYLNLQWLNRLSTMFEWKKKTESAQTIDIPTLETFGLQSLGYNVIFKYNDKYYNTFATLGGVPDIRYRPSLAIVSNPQIPKSLNLEIYGSEFINKPNQLTDGQCVLMRNTTTLQSFLDAILRWNALTVENDISLYQMLIHTRNPNMKTAPDKRTKDALEEAEKKLVEGDIVVPIETPLFDGVKSFNTPSTGENITDLIELGQYCYAKLANEFGLDANYNMKREAIGASEVELNADVLTPLVRDALKCRKEDIEKCKECFGEDILEVDLGEPWKKRVEEENKTVEEEVVEDKEVVEDEQKENVAASDSELSD